MRHENNAAQGKRSEQDVRSAAKKALLQMLEPLAGFVSDSGLSAAEISKIFREAAVRNAAAKQLQVSDRLNISGIAATTGISRADISRILRSTADSEKGPTDGQQQLTNRILAAWHQDPKFTGSNGNPRDLSIYGRGVTFEALIKKYGRGIPARAVLDELVRVGAIELMDDQKVRAKSLLAIDTGVSPRVIKAFGDMAFELLSTMLVNMREPKSAKFIASVSNTTVSLRSLPLLRKEISTRGANFLADVEEVFTRKNIEKTSKSGGKNVGRVSLTVFVHEDLAKRQGGGLAASKRRNFRRGA